jgi:hypothetical protein
MAKGKKKGKCCERYRKKGRRCADCPLQGQEQEKKKDKAKKKKN